METIEVDPAMKKFIEEVMKKREQDQILANTTGHKPCSSEILEARAYMVRKNKDVNALAGLVSAIIYE